MLAIRMQRTGRKGHAMFRVIVQDSRRTPTSGKIVAQLGSYDPHAKTVVIDKEKASFYLTNGAQPSGRAAVLLKSEGVELPKWVSLSDSKTRSVRNADKRRSTRPAEEITAEPEAAVEDVVTPEEATQETPAQEAATEETAPATEETPASEAATPPVEETEVKETAAATEESAPKA